MRPFGQIGLGEDAIEARAGVAVLVDLLEGAFDKGLTSSFRISHPSSGVGFSLHLAYHTD
jgi:hypothetical protein